MTTAGIECVTQDAVDNRRRMRPRVAGERKPNDEPPARQPHLCQRTTCAAVCGPAEAGQVFTDDQLRDAAAGCLAIWISPLRATAQQVDELPFALGTLAGMKPILVTLGTSVALAGERARPDGKSGAPEMMINYVRNTDAVSDDELIPAATHLMQQHLSGARATEVVARQKADEDRETVIYYWVRVGSDNLLVYNHLTQIKDLGRSLCIAESQQGSARHEDDVS